MWNGLEVILHLSLEALSNDDENNGIEAHFSLHDNLTESPHLLNVKLRQI